MKKPMKLDVLKTIPNSSNVARVGMVNEDLVVEFLNGSIYSYSDFGPEMFESLLKAESAGKFLNQSVKGKFEFQKLDDVFLTTEEQKPNNEI